MTATQPRPGGPGGQPGDPGTAVGSGPGGGAAAPGWYERVEELTNRSIYGGDRTALPAAEAELDALEADLCLARGRLLHARYLEVRDDGGTHDAGAPEREREMCERAVELYRRLGDRRGVAEALFWLGTAHQVIWQDNDTARPLYERAEALATEVGDLRTLYEVVRHVGFIDYLTEQRDAAVARLEESLRVARQAEFAPGVAAALVSLADLLTEYGRPEQARPLLAEAVEVAEACGAGEMLRQARQVEAHL